MKTAPSTYVSGHCSIGRHDTCRGVYAGVVCVCEHHTAPPPSLPPPEVLGEFGTTAAAETLELFHIDVAPAADELAGLSADRRRTARRRADVARGVHPLTGGKARPELGTCGDCAHRILVGWHNRTWPKCDLTEMTHGPGSDCRAWWPACSRFEPGDQLSDDAARWTPEHADRTGARA